MSESAYLGAPVYDSYDLLYDLICSKIGEDAASFFARPEITRSNGASLTSVAWYTSIQGSGVQWVEAGPDVQLRAARLIEGILLRIRPLLVDETSGPILQRWLNVPDLADSLYMVSGRPVLINWGLLPTDASERPLERERLFGSALGLFAPWLKVPPFLSQDPMSETVESGDAPAVPKQDAPAVRKQSEESELTGGQSTGAEPGLRAVIVEATGTSVCRGTWMPVTVACGVAALVLLLLFVPGVLLYPLPSNPAVDIAASEAVLHRRIADLQAGLTGGVCSAERDPLSPIGLLRPTEGGLAPIVVPDTAVPKFEADEAAPTTVAPVPRQVELTPPGDTGVAVTLVDVLDAAAVLVVGQTSEGIATGTGFFVNETDVVTNRHVVEAVEQGRLSIVNKALGGLVSAEVIKTSPSSTIAAPDFALLRIAPGARAHGTLALAGTVRRAENVLAYGYPSFVMQTDSEYRCLIEGNQNCVPVGSITQGFVTALQQGEDALGLIVHSAAISEGNSGGPLLNYCGEVVGVNTFGRRDVDRVQSLNFAQQSADIARFLGSAGARFDTAGGGCRLIPKDPPVGAPPVEATGN